jgi:hypothetical protein
MVAIAPRWRVVFGPGVPAHGGRDENYEGGKSGVDDENLIPDQGRVGLNAFNEVKSEPPKPESLGPFARPSSLLRGFAIPAPYHHRNYQTRESERSNSNVVHLGALAEQIDRQRERIPTEIRGGGHQQMSRLLLVRCFLESRGSGPFWSYTWLRT